MTVARLVAAAATLAIVALAIALAVQSDRIAKIRAAEVQARAARQAAALEAAGWRKVAEASQAELARVVPKLRAELEAARAAGATVALAGHWEGAGETVWIPCDLAGTPAPPGGTTEAARTPTAPAVPTTPHVKIEDAVAIDDAGGIYVKRDVQARFSVGESWSSSWVQVTPEVPPVIAVDPRLSEAWAAYRNPPPPKRWAVRLGLGAPGPSVRAGASYIFWRNVGVWADAAVPVRAGEDASAGAGVELRF